MKTLQQPNTPRTKPTDSFDSFDAVSGLSLCGGIPRTGDDVVDTVGTTEYPNPKTVERGNRRAAAYAKFQSDAAAAAKSMGQRCQYTTNVSYFPATNPTFSQDVRTRIWKTAELASTSIAAATAAASPDVSDVSPEQVPVLVDALQTLRIRLNVDHTSMTVDELRALCEETSRAEAVAYAAAHNSPTSTQPRPHNDPLMIKHEFVKRMRMDLEYEYLRCRKRFNVSAQSPTPHVRIASIDRQPVVWLGHVISPDTLARTFVSVNALMSVVSTDVQQFLICPSRGSDRVAVVAVVAAVAAVAVPV